MAIASVNRSIIGKTLLEPVQIDKGGMLFPKDHTFKEEDLEFLYAFHIQNVVVKDDAKSTSRKQDESQVEEQSKQETQYSVRKFEKDSEFYQQYEKAANFMEKLMRDVASGATIPVMEIRTWLKPLIDQVKFPSSWVSVLQTNQGWAKYTYYHMVSVALISAMIARANKFDEAEIMQIALAGLLSDIGKSKIDPNILHKAGALTAEEFAEMKNHTVLGYHIIRVAKGLTEGVALAALQHHERLDGSGYPLGLRGDQIHRYAKIVAIADVFHAISSIRVYKDKESPIRAIEQIRYENVGKFDPGYVHVFFSSFTQMPLGTMVRLNDGRLGKMIYVDPIHPTRPMLEVDGEVVALMQNKHLYINEILN